MLLSERMIVSEKFPACIGLKIKVFSLMIVNGLADLRLIEME